MLSLYHNFIRIARIFYLVCHLHILTYRATPDGPRMSIQKSSIIRESVQSNFSILKFYDSDFLNKVILRMTNEKNSLESELKDEDDEFSRSRYFKLKIIILGSIP